ncbi:MarR family winged helix-turn-helix transcriptional regulator [Lacipirellula limnantheis]|uniref:MarR family protein n=1 Tax=Lacipirellula limnantheis TaxID=2528024 RepID=A0A517U3G3_9BACT|nr:MarR family transcriptional regulator [Lacipirellula limnantheis]QDT75160.1 MarR family protein [Lacipirellula limnantheis]
MSFRGNLADSGPAPLAASDCAVAERIDAVCQLVVHGKLAARQLATWLSGVEINEPEFRLMWLLAGAARFATDGGISIDQSGLAARLAVSAAQVSGAVERLRSVGLLERASDTSDRRRQLWRVTVAGEQVLRGIVERAAAAEPRGAAA